jgi:hypothetical protein
MSEIPLNSFRNMLQKATSDTIAEGLSKLNCSVVILYDDSIQYTWWQMLIWGLFNEIPHEHKEPPFWFFVEYVLEFLGIVKKEVPTPPPPGWHYATDEEMQGEYIMNMKQVGAILANPSLAIIGDKL